ncbi:DUF692 domain-containing protein [Sandaracinus amylolyticus]|uniref:Xylose isomerase-like TIM barrel domain-containing protein n=1 Tax=Sandaracinus amylolyticus TaxID=927083 RepID=A0A0F6W4F6_9BACT|nr:DUF692 family multinuclear iron-containing protein [Sandaracinus amylolyticus]AKF07155.1 Hypothetical protein DB32_004304 [Sandaracinus amylolyticus]
MIGVGFALPPDDETLARVAPIARRADYLEVTPETTWIDRDDGALVPNGFHARFLAAVRAWNKPVVAHGVGFSTCSEGDEARTRAWLDRMREDVALFGYAWWTDHLGATSLRSASGAGSETTALPMPMPYDARTASTLRARLELMSRVVPDVGVENSVVYFVLGDPLDEPRLLHDVLAAPHRHLLLDLHNLHTMSLLHGLDPQAWLARAPLDRVIELHVSGGRESDPRWLPSGRTMRLDGHDDAVPEPVWALLDDVLPRCPHLRGVTLERMEGTVPDHATARLLDDELTRIRRAITKAAR